MPVLLGIGYNYQQIQFKIRGCYHKSFFTGVR
jgi:hypothetical protein